MLLGRPIFRGCVRFREGIYISSPGRLVQWTIARRIESRRAVRTSLRPSFGLKKPHFRRPKKCLKKHRFGISVSLNRVGKEFFESWDVGDVACFCFIVFFGFCVLALVCLVL